MIKYISGKRNLFKFETESEKLSPVNNSDWYLGADDYFILDEDGILNGEELHKGDLVITLMDGKVAFKAPDNVADTIINYIEELERKKEEREGCNQAYIQNCQIE